MLTALLLAVGSSPGNARVQWLHKSGMEVAALEMPSPTTMLQRLCRGVVLGDLVRTSCEELLTVGFKEKINNEMAIVTEELSSCRYDTN